MRRGVIAALAACGTWAPIATARAGELVLSSGVHVAVGDGDARRWRVTDAAAIDGARGDGAREVLTMAGASERIEVSVAAADATHSCASVVARTSAPVDDGGRDDAVDAKPSDVAWGRGISRDFGLVRGFDPTLRIDNSRAGEVARIACASDGTLVLTARWIAYSDETPEQLASAARVLLAIDDAYRAVAVGGRDRQPAARIGGAPTVAAAAGDEIPSLSIERSLAGDGGAAAPSLADAADGAPVARAPAAMPPAPRGEQLSPTDDAGSPDRNEGVVEAVLPGRDALVPYAALGFASLEAARSSAATSGAMAIVERPIVPLTRWGTTSFGYELAATAGLDDRSALSASGHAGLGYHAMRGVVGVWLVGGVAGDYVGTGGAAGTMPMTSPTGIAQMPLGVAAEPGVYGGAVARTFPFEGLLLELRAARLARLGSRDESEATLRATWAPPGHRAMTMSLFARDYDQIGTMFGTAIGVGL